jgi:hypothetical protein
MKLFCKVIKKNWNDIIVIIIVSLLVIISITYFCYKKRLESQVFNQRYYSHYILKNLIENYNYFHFHLSNENVTNTASESWNRFFASHFFYNAICKQEQIVIRENGDTTIFCLMLGIGVEKSLYILASKNTTEYIVLFCYDRVHRSPFTMYAESKNTNSLYIASGLVEINLQTASYDQAMSYILTRKKRWQLFAWLDENMELHY